jgi:hypothetical protein
MARTLTPAAFGDVQSTASRISLGRFAAQFVHQVGETLLRFSATSQSFADAPIGANLKNASGNLKI